jgi:hypothetical protein
VSSSAALDFLSQFRLNGPSPGIAELGLNRHGPPAIQTFREQAYSNDQLDHYATPLFTKTRSWAAFGRKCVETCAKARYPGFGNASGSTAAAKRDHIRSYRAVPRRVKIPAGSSFRVVASSGHHFPRS